MLIHTTPQFDPKVELLPAPIMLIPLKVLLVASPTNFKVLVPVVVETVVLEKVKFPPPLMVTLSAPLKVINGEPAVAAPLTVQGPPLGAMVNEAQFPAPKLAPPAASDVLFVILIVMLADA